MASLEELALSLYGNQGQQGLSPDLKEAIAQENSYNLFEGIPELGSQSAIKLAAANPSSKNTKDAFIISSLSGLLGGLLSGAKANRDRELLEGYRSSFYTGNRPEDLPESIWKRAQDTRSIFDLAKRQEEKDREDRLQAIKDQVKIQYDARNENDPKIVDPKALEAFAELYKEVGATNPEAIAALPMEQQDLFQNLLGRKAIQENAARSLDKFKEDLKLKERSLGVREHQGKERLNLAKGAEEEKKKQLALVKYEPLEGFALSNKDAAKIKDMLAQNEKLVTALDQFATSGDTKSFDLMGGESAVQQALTAKIKILGKIREQMGASFTANEERLLDATLPVAASGNLSEFVKRNLLGQDQVVFARTLSDLIKREEAYSALSGYGLKLRDAFNPQGASFYPERLRPGLIDEGEKGTVAVESATPSVDPARVSFGGAIYILDPATKSYKRAK